jgi:RimJ/RimL family protein N-acetyltransferase
MEDKSLAESPRLRLETLRPDHAQGLFDALADPRVYEHIRDAPPESVAALTAQFSRWASGPPADCADELWLNVAIRRRDDGCLIGRLQATIVNRQAEVAYLIGPEHWGQGYATEAMAAFQNSIRQNLNVTQFWAITLPQNKRSLALLERLGYQQVSGPLPPLSSYDDGDLVFVLG